MVRHGHTDVIDTYLNRDRIDGGEAESMADAAYEAWKADRRRGLV